MAASDRQFIPVGPSAPLRFRPASRDELWHLIALTADFYWFTDLRDRCRRLYRSRSIPTSHPLCQNLPGSTLHDTGARPLTDADRRRLREAMRSGHSYSHVVVRVPGGGDNVVLSVSRTPDRDRHGRPRGYHCCAMDISRRHRTEERTRRLQRLYSALSETNEAILRARTQEALYENVCQAAIKGGRFQISTILTPDESGRMVALARAGAPLSRNLPRAPISVSREQPGGGGISGEAWRTGQPVISNDFMSDPRLRYWHAYAREYHLQSAAAYPIRRRGKLFALLLFYAGERNAFDPEISALLENLCANVSYALESFASDAERRRAESRIRESEARFRSLTGLSSDFYWEQDTGFRFTQYEGHVVGDANRRAVRQLIGSRLDDVPGLWPADVEWEELRKQQQHHETFRDFEFTFVNEEGVTYHFSLSGEPIFNDAGEFRGYRGISRDVTEKRNITEQIRHMATHDSLTGLPNRAMFMELLEQGVRSARRYPETAFAVLFIDLDRFKSVNDTYGHHAGDQLLQDVAEQLREPLRASDLIARLGGDEFVVLLQHVTEEAEAAATAHKLLELFKEPIPVRGHSYAISASIGISLYGRDARDAESLMQHADSAMYLAKEQGRNNVQFFLEEINRSNRERIRMERLLRDALPDQLSLAYQGRFSTQDGSPTGVEALLRWHNDELGDVPPSRFIPLAEDSGLILEMGVWVLRQSCRQVMEWSRQGLPPLSLSVNLSARQFTDPELPERIRDALTDSGLPPERLELEITESTVMLDTARAVKMMHQIRALGVCLALDDFGTGYSSLGQLRHYPLDTLKIDRSFISGLGESGGDRAIIQAIINMGHTLGLTVVAEGVETHEQQRFLRDKGCDQLQGFLCHRPEPAAEIALFRSRDSE